MYDLLPGVLRLVPLIHLRRLFEVDGWNGDAVGEVRQVVTDVKFPRHEDKFPVVLLENHRRRVRYNQYPTEKRNISTDQQFQMNRYISQFLEFYWRKEKPLGLDFNQFSNLFYCHQLVLSIHF